MDVEADIYRNFLESCPFNNATELFWRQGERPHQEDKFGYDCVHQSQALARILCQGVLGMDSHLCNRTGTPEYGLHTAVACQQWGQFRLYDPALLLGRAINISRMFSDQTSETVPIFPTMSPRRVHCLRSASTNSIQLEYQTYCPPSEDYDESFTLNKSYEFQWSKPLPPAVLGRIYCPSSIHNPVSILRMHWLRHDGFLSAIQLETDTGRMGLRQYNGVDSYLVWRHSSPDQFSDEISRIENRRGIVRGGIIDFFERAWEIYKELHPDWNNGVPPF